MPTDCVYFWRARQSIHKGVYDSVIIRVIFPGQQTVDTVLTLIFRRDLSKDIYILKKEF